jgi:peptidyl-dipeptidase Dcp
MTSLRDQEKLDGEVRPLVLNVMNFNKGTDGEPTLLSFDDARTLFHEFGHGLHGLMSEVTYPMISGTGVLQDFVELPSQLYEHWLDRPEILERFARHYRTGAPMPQPHRARSTRATSPPNISARPMWISTSISAAPRTPRRSRPRPGCGRRCPTRSCCGTGRRISSTSFPATTMLPATTAICGPRAFNAFEETGDVFDPATARRLRDHIYAAGGARDPSEAYQAFRGRMPSVDPLLKKRGLIAETA